MEIPGAADGSAGTQPERLLFAEPEDAMPQNVRILLVEDDESDAELALRALPKMMTGRRRADA